MSFPRNYATGRHFGLAGQGGKTIWTNLPVGSGNPMKVSVALAPLISHHLRVSLNVTWSDGARGSLFIYFLYIFLLPLFPKHTLWKMNGPAPSLINNIYPNTSTCTLSSNSFPLWPWLYNASHLETAVQSISIYYQSMQQVFLLRRVGVMCCRWCGGQNYFTAMDLFPQSSGSASKFTWQKWTF